MNKVARIVSFANIYDHEPKRTCNGKGSTWRKTELDVARQSCRSQPRYRDVFCAKEIDKILYRAVRKLVKQRDL